MLPVERNGIYNFAFTMIKRRAIFTVIFSIPSHPYTEIHLISNTYPSRPQNTGDSHGRSEDADSSSDEGAGDIPGRLHVEVRISNRHMEANE